jgi:hypothetical protein
LKDVVLVKENGIKAMGDKLTGSLLQAYWASGEKRAIPWDVINKFAEDDSGKTSSEEDNVKGAVNATSSAVNATSIEEDDVEGAAKANATSTRPSQPSWPSWSSWPSPRTCGACCCSSCCRRRPRPSKGRSAW